MTPVIDIERRNYFTRLCALSADSMVSLGELDPFFRVALMGFALILALLMGVATVRARSVKLLLVSLGFLAFFVIGLLLTLGLFLEGASQTFQASSEVLIITFVALVLIYAGMVKAS